LDSHDSRIIFGGKVLRKSCIDELPQLWNILLGNMSLVGPRPCIPYEAHEYLRWHTHRFDTMPGLSGLWQISGKNKLTFKQMIRLDIAYCDNITLLGDLQIIIKTPFAILKMVFESVLSKVVKKVETDRIISVSPESPYGEKIRGAASS
jgi:lipopolysaccharide/colanic/teichoic acid biosynthesis glycosyltransferase